MIPKHVSEAIKAQFPGVKMYHHDGFAPGFAVELNGMRNAWLVRNDEQWDAALDRALAWLAKQGAHSDA